MKSLNSLIVLILIAAFGLTGCYTQLEYSQRVKRITDEKPKRGYAVNEETEQDQEEEVYYGDDEYIPVYYRDYDRAAWWASCYCNPYSGYSFGTSLFFSDPWYYNHASHWHHRFYNRYGFHSPFMFSRWNHWSRFGFGFHHNSFAVSLHWGSPYYYSYWDYPFYSYSSFYYGPYWAGYHYRPYWYGYGNYYGGYWGNNGSGNDAVRSSRTYRPRSIGTSRVSDGTRGNRARSINRSAIPDNTGSSIRSRGTGSTRTDRGSVQQDSRTRVQQPRSRGTSRVGTSVQSDSRNNVRNNSRGTVQQRSRSDNSNSRTTRSRSNRQNEQDNPQQKDRNNNDRVSVISIQGTQQYNNVNRSQLNRSVIESRIRQQRVAPPAQSNDSNNRSSFFGRVGEIFKNSTTNDSFKANFGRSRNTVKSSRSIFRQRSGSSGSRSTIKSSSSSTRKSVTRSRSSSSSRSRGTSNNKRSSSSSRSRGNN